MQGTIEDIVAEGDKVVVRFTIRGTQQGAFAGMPPTSKPVAMTGISIIRIVGGKFEEEWENADSLGMLQQLGAIPTLG
jgi:predicted ester cyclase